MSFNYQTKNFDGSNSKRPGHGRGGFSTNPRDRPNNLRSYRQVLVLAFKGTPKEKIQECFARFGQIEQIKATSGNVKGFNITYSKTSEACRAMEEMHLRLMDGYPKPLKVILSIPKDELLTKMDCSFEHLKKLEVVVPAGETKESILEHFGQWGDIEYVNVVSVYNERRASIKFYRSLHTAIAGESCDFTVWKPRFKIPIEEEKVRQKNAEPKNTGFSGRYPGDELSSYQSNCGCILELSSSTPRTELPQSEVRQLVSAVPNLLSCNHNAQTGSYVVEYEFPECAAFAMERLNGFHFGYGHILKIVPHNSVLQNQQRISSVSQVLQQSMEMAQATGDLSLLAQSMKKAAELLEQGSASHSGIPHHVPPTHQQSRPAAPQVTRAEQAVTIALPARRFSFVPSAEANGHVWFQIKRPFSQELLEDLALRFGDLVEGNFLNSKTFGFLHFTTQQAATDFILTLDGVEVQKHPIKCQPCDKPRLKRQLDGVPSNQPDSKKVRLDDDWQM